VTTVSTRQLLFVFIQNKFSGLKWNNVYIKAIGSAIINFSLVLSKKWVRVYRNNNKFNKMHQISSDPYISSIRELPNKYRLTFSDDLQNLFMFPEYTDKSTDTLNSSFSEMEIINESEL
jgi:hypothetical protein